MSNDSFFVMIIMIIRGNLSNSLFIQRFQRLKALYNLIKEIPAALMPTYVLTTRFNKIFTSQVIDIIYLIYLLDRRVLISPTRFSFLFSLSMSLSLSLSPFL